MSDRALTTIHPTASGDHPMVSTDGRDPSSTGPEATSTARSDSTTAVVPSSLAPGASVAGTVAEAVTSHSTSAGGTTSSGLLKRPQHNPTTGSTNSNSNNSNNKSNHGGSGSTIKKRPYRRTKRPKNYNDRSTVTVTTTNPADAAGNVYDAVLGECEDLLKASLEAQRLGRLKMASAYQLLLHTRLVGLGKRFDRSAMLLPPTSSSKRRHGGGDGGDSGKGAEEVEVEDDDDDDENDDDENDGKAVARKRIPMTGDGHSGVVGGQLVPQVPPSSAAVLQQLSSILPSNLEMDATMMEHLARAAVELHHQRTGRKKSADGLLASPMNGLMTTTHGGGPDDGIVAGAVGGGTSPGDGSASAVRRPFATALTTTTTTATSTTDSKVEWTPAETAAVHKALAEKKAPYAIAKLLPNKTEAQVKGFLKNQQQLSKLKKLTSTPTTVTSTTTPISAAIMGGGGGGGAGGTSTHVAMTLGSKRKARHGNVRGGNDDGEEEEDDEVYDDDDGGGEDDTPNSKKRGGRGRKPPTTAMNTVPNITMDVKALLRQANVARLSAPPTPPTKNVTPPS